MTGLAPELAPWAALLAGMRPRFQRALGEYLRHLAPAFSVFSAPRHAAAGEPDGLDGLARRGSYERLLMSEWLLADEAPDEFLRRAANGEHAFFTLRQRDPREARSCAVLVDAGPDQLGAPQLVHFAVLTLMARRAEDARAELRWGLLQDPATEIRAFSQDTARSLLAARYARDPRPDDLAAWAWLVDDAPRPDEVWLIGGPTVARLLCDRPVNRVVVGEVLAQHERALAVTVAPAHAPRREVRLGRPSIADETMLLRDPFASEERRDRAAIPSRRGPTLTVDRASPLVFRDNGIGIFVGLADGRWCLRKVKGALRRGGRDRFVTPTPGARIVALGWRSKSVLRAELDSDGALWLRGGDSLRYTRRPARSFPLASDAVAAALGEARGPGELHVSPGLGEQVSFVCGRQLWRVGEDNAVAREPGRLLTSVVYQQGGAWLVDGDDGAQLFRVHGEGAPSSSRPFGVARAASEWALAGPMGWPRDVAVAWRAAADRVAINIKAETFSVPVDSSERLVGAVSRRPTPYALEAITLDRGDTALSFVSATERHEVPTDGSRILRVAVSPEAPVVAWLTEEGELGAFHRDEDRIVLSSRVELT